MQTFIRLKLDAAGRVVGFCHLHSAGDPAITPVTQRLDELHTRAVALLDQHRSSQTTGSAAVDDKARLRAAIENQLGALFGIARVAARTDRGIAIHRRLPRAHTSEVTLLTTARVALAEATAIKDQLIPFGLEDALLQGLSADLEAYGAALGRQRQALTDQVGANADLKAITADIMAVMKNLDAIYRVRFKNDRELMAAWKSARNVAWPSQATELPVTPATPTPPAPDQASAA